MHDVIASYMLSQEIDRQVRDRRLDRIDPDDLYRYEIWDSIGSAPSLRERLGSVINWIRIRGRATGTANTSEADVCVPTQQCAPQI